jgi:hypothetical protein
VDEFELMRKRLKQRGATTGQERQQELSRQFASLGNLPSGAAIKTRQQAATASERATNEATQDINILEAQTLRQEREGEAQRGLQRELQSEQIGFQEREGAATRTAQFDIANLGAETDLEKARMAGANAIELQNLANDAAERRQILQESGLDERAANTLSQNKALFDLELEFKKEGQSFAQEIAKSELDLNKSVTALNSVDLLRANGFDHNDVSGILIALGIPHADRITDFLMRGATGAPNSTGVNPADPNVSGGYSEGQVVKNNGRLYRYTRGNWELVPFASE